jgi:hypothetical protein
MKSFTKLFADENGIDPQRERAKLWDKIRELEFALFRRYQHNKDEAREELETANTKNESEQSFPQRKI